MPSRSSGAESVLLRTRKPETALRRLLLECGGSSLKVWLETPAPLTLNFISNSVASKPRALLRQVHRESGNFNFQSGDRARIAEALGAAIKKYPSTRILIGMAGLAAKRDQQALRRALHRIAHFRPRTLALMTDWELALERQFSDRNGLIAVLGTGSVFAAKGGGNLIRVGGYGRIIGDVGSGYAIGRSAVEAYLQALDSDAVVNAADKKFIAAMARRFPNRERVIESVYRNGLELQTLAPDILALAAQGSRTARRILETEASSVLTCFNLLLSNRSVKKLRQRAEPLPVLLYGGLVETDNFYRRLLVRRLRTELKLCVITTSAVKP